ncbi:Predicted PurR-regulated permease PerM [Clostridium amylolyticum]|uniref:Predicted PurR-regulated permease PerM n=1 Tax=Clostridium amylolyticum TaxID=1121298 RepID=A0A1M6IRN4_9CLOT|nr:AI-2E family transporter [Clostridium amylolyticum]SHJ36999.1 Predicted PurR-regulated permease PerM [Clostridium amylolyticum]
MNNKKITLTLINILLSLLILYVFTKLDYIFKPIGKIANSLIVPIIFTIFFYYVLRPVVNYINIKDKHKTLAVIVTVLLFVTALATLLKYGISVVTKEFQGSTANGELINLNSFKDFFGESIGDYVEKFNINEKILSYLSNVVSYISTYFFDFFTSISNTFTQIIIIPFLLFYLLKDDTKFAKGLLDITPDKYKHIAKTTLKEIDETLSSYIKSQMVVSLVIGVMMLLAYKIIGMPNALFLACFSAITTVIPFLGPILGIIPAILLGLTINLNMVLKIIIASIIVQQLEENLVTPNIMSNKLNLHPLTVIIVILISLSVFGILGAFIAVPLYTSLIIIFRNTGKAYHMRKIEHTFETK